MVDTACAVIAPAQAKAPTTPTDINTFHCTYGHTHEVLLKKTVEQQGVNLNGEFNECRGCSMAKGLRKSIVRSTHTSADTLCSSRPSAATAPYCRRGGVYSGGGCERGGASSQGGGSIQDLDSESNLDNMTEVRPPVPPAMCEEPAAETGAGAAGVRKTTLRHSGRADFGGINGSSNSCSSDESRTNNDSGDIAALVA